MPPKKKKAGGKKGTKKAKAKKETENPGEIFHSNVHFIIYLHLISIQNKKSEKNGDTDLPLLNAFFMNS